MILLEAAPDVAQVTEDAGAIAQFLNQYGLGLGMVAIFGGIAFMLWRKCGHTKAKDAALILAACAMAWSVTGCACSVQKEAIRASVNVLEPVIHDLEDRANATESERLANQKQLDTLKAATE